MAQKTVRAMAAVGLVMVVAIYMLHIAEHHTDSVTGVAGVAEKDGTVSLIRSLQREHREMTEMLKQSLDQMKRMEGEIRKCNDRSPRDDAPPAAAAAADCPTCAACPPPPPPRHCGGCASELQKGALHQQVYHLGRDEPLPHIGAEFFPFETRLGVRYARVLGQDVRIADNITESCNYYDVLFTRNSKEVKRCTMIVDQQNLWNENFLGSNLVSFRMNRTTGKPEMPEVRDVHTLHDKQRFTGRDDRLSGYMLAKTEMTGQVRALLDPENTGKVEGVPVLVMCFNKGMTSLIVNFFCGLRKVGIPVPKHIIFAATAADAAIIAAMGFVAFSHPGLGSYPDKAALTYGDEVFAAMMMLKQFSVQITMEAGYDVLFQDADVVWKTDPVPRLKERSRFFHAQFQDDGGRSEVFHPYFANTGFFYLRNAFITRIYWDQVTLSMPPYVGRTGNQWIANQVLEIYVKRRQFKVSILPFREYPSGRYLEHPLAKKDGEPVKPIFPESRIIHFCWTGNLSDKVLKMEAYNELHVPKARMIDMADHIRSTHGQGSQTVFDELCLVE